MDELPGSVVPYLRRFLHRKGVILPQDGYSIHIYDDVLKVSVRGTEVHRCDFFYARKLQVFYLRSGYLENYFVSGSKFLRGFSRDVETGYICMTGLGYRTISTDTIKTGLVRRRAAKVLRQVIPRVLIPAVCQYIEYI